MALELSQHRHHLHRTIDFGGRYYLIPHRHENKNYFEICSNQVDTSAKNFVRRFMIMCVAFSIGYIKVNYTTVFMGIRKTAVDVKIPFIEKNSNEEFTLNYIAQTGIHIWGFFGFLCMEMAMEIVVLPVAITPKLINFEFRKLDEQMEERQLIRLEVCVRIRNIVQQAMDIDMYSIFDFYSYDSYIFLHFPQLLSQLNTLLLLAIPYWSTGFLI